MAISSSILSTGVAIFSGVAMGGLAVREPQVRDADGSDVLVCGSVSGKLGTVSGGATVGHDAGDTESGRAAPARTGREPDLCRAGCHRGGSDLHCEGEGADVRRPTVAGTFSESRPADAGHRSSVDAGGTLSEVGGPVAVFAGVVASGIREAAPVALRGLGDGRGPPDDDLGHGAGGRVPGADAADGSPAVRRDGCLLCQSRHVQCPPGRRRDADHPVTA